MSAERRGGELIPVSKRPTQTYMWNERTCRARKVGILLPEFVFMLLDVEMVDAGEDVPAGCMRVEVVNISARPPRRWARKGKTGHT